MLKRKGALVLEQSNEQKHEKTPSMVELLCSELLCCRLLIRCQVDQATCCGRCFLWTGGGAWEGGGVVSSCC